MQRGADRPSLTRAAATGVSAARIDLSQHNIVVRGLDAVLERHRRRHGPAGASWTPGRGRADPVDDYAAPGRDNLRRQLLVPGGLHLVRRHVVSVASAKSATVGGKRLSSSQQSAVLNAGAAFTVWIRRLERPYGHRERRDDRGHRSPPEFDCGAAPTVVLYTYQLTGRITDASGQPVAGAFVVTRTANRNLDVSQPVRLERRLPLVLTASDQAGKDPVPLSMQVTFGSVTYGAPLGVTVNFKALRSANVNFQLPSSPSGTLVPSTPTTKVGAIYEGLLVGVQGAHGAIVPVGGNWPDKRGNFRLVLPASDRGKTVAIYEDLRQFSRRQRPCRAVPLRRCVWPHGLDQKSSAAPGRDQASEVGAEDARACNDGFRGRCVVAATCALSASAAKQPTAAQRTAISSAVQRFWCGYIPKNEGPCSRWTVRVPSILVSTIDPSWGLARMTDRTAGKTALPAGFNVFVHKGGKTSWKVFKWFSTLRASPAPRPRARRSARARRERFRPLRHDRPPAVDPRFVTVTARTRRRHARILPVPLSKTTTKGASRAESASPPRGGRGTRRCRRRRRGDLTVSERRLRPDL